MVRSSIGACVLGGVMAVAGAAAAQHPRLIPAQWWQAPPPVQMEREFNCEQARQALQEIQARWYYAPPWEQQRMAAWRDFIVQRQRMLNCPW
ncbi:MAG: hypothetical protein AB7H90_18855 [Alphaproteobacteria bacterium]